MEKALETLKSFQPVSQKSVEELPAIITSTLDILSSVPLSEIALQGNNLKENVSIILEIFKILRGVCPKGKKFQNLLIENEELHRMIRQILEMKASEYDELLYKLRLSTVQLLFNMSVGENTYKIFNSFRDTFVKGLDPDFATKKQIPGPEHDKFANTVALMLFNVINKPIHVRELLESGELLQVLEFSLKFTIKDELLPENVQLLLNAFVTTVPQTAIIYKNLCDDSRLQFLYFIHATMKEEEINQELLDHLILQFKQTSDLVLKPDGTGTDRTSPKEIYVLLEIIAVASHGESEMKDTVSMDPSLFLNLGCLLMSIQKLGKDPKSIFAPIQKLEQLAPNSTHSSSIENEISYKFKTLLVQTLANLLYKNKRNQELVREMDILIAILDCTNVDARNPLIKEYAIFAIRNACENNLENQQLIASLTKIKNIKSEIVTEISESVIRIQK